MPTVVKHQKHQLAYHWGAHENYSSFRCEEEISLPAIFEYLEVVWLGLFCLERYASEGDSSFCWGFWPLSCWTCPQNDRAAEDGSLRARKCHPALFFQSKLYVQVVEGQEEHYSTAIFIPIIFLRNIWVDRFSCQWKKRYLFFRNF